MVKSTIPSKKHEDREHAAKTAYEPTSVEILTPRTMVLLLASAEDPVLIKALSTLDRYASKMEQNAAMLLEEGVLRLLTPLLGHPELLVKRFATKLTSELTFLPAAAQLLLDDQLIPTIVGLLNNVEDNVVKEFASSILAELSQAKQGRQQLIDSQLVHIFCPLLTHPDPDVQKNCLQVIHNLLKGSVGRDQSAIVGQEGFNVKAFSDLMTSEYVEIQNLALDVMVTLTGPQASQDSPSMAARFQQVGGVQRMLTILKNYEWKDIHGKCLDLLGNLYEDPGLAEQAFKEGMLQLFGYMDLIGDAQLRGKALEVIAKVTRVPAGRKMLVDSGQVGVLGPTVLETAGPVSTAACHTVSALASDPSALQALLTLQIPGDLLTVLAGEGRDWTNRGAAAHALHQILTRDSDTCALVVDSDHKDVFAAILNKLDEEVPVPAAVATANCVTALASCPSLRQRIVTPGLVSGLLRCFQDRKEDCAPLRVAACETLSSLMCEGRARDLLRAQDGLATVWRNLTAPNNQAARLPLLQAAARLVQLSVSGDPSLAGSLVSLGAVQWLLSRSSLRHECPAWETALESIFAKFLPIKFALTGRLDLTDTTEHGFYITRTPLTRQQLDSHQFPILSDIVANTSCPRQLLYVANFNSGPPLQPSVSRSSRAKRSTTTVQSNSRSSQSIRSQTFLYNCDKIMQSDEHLVKYIEDLKKILLENGLLSEETKAGCVEDSSSVQRRAAQIGQFVARRMSGLDRGAVCTAHCLDLHINEIKVELMNSVIPVGCLRAGLQLERALLFKVLADRVGLTAGLVRGPRGLGWVEVALPVLPPSPRPALPNHLLRPNQVVDLMSSPGTLYPVGSYEAELYCGSVTRN